MERPCVNCRPIAGRHPVDFARGNSTSAPEMGTLVSLTNLKKSIRKCHCFSWSRRLSLAKTATFHVEADCRRSAEGADPSRIRPVHRMTTLRLSFQVNWMCNSIFSKFPLLSVGRNLVPRYLGVDVLKSRAVASRSSPT